MTAKGIGQPAVAPGASQSRLLLTPSKRGHRVRERPKISIDDPLNLVQVNAKVLVSDKVAQTPNLSPWNVRLQCSGFIAERL